MNTDKTIYHKDECINLFLLSKYERFSYTSEHTYPTAFCIHVSIINDLEKVLYDGSITMSGLEICEYELHIYGKCFDMRIITIPQANNENILYLRSIIKKSQVSFAWQDKSNLFINENAFNILKEFITAHNLDKYILEINHQPGISATAERITVVTFKQIVNEFNIIEKYTKYLRSIKTYKRPKYYYMTNAFSWLQPQWMKHFKIPLDDEINVIVPIILQHLGTLKYGGELNIFELLSLRLALCDYRNPFPTSIIKNEIDFMIMRKLTKIVQNNHLDIHQYFFKEMSLQRDLLIDYLVYEFQYHFETVKYADSVHSSGSGGTGGIGFIKLDREINVLHTIKWNRNTYYNISGCNYDKMSLSLFLDLIECHNVVTIRLDTDYTFVNDLCKFERSQCNRNSIIQVYFEGNNASNFIENFVSSFKTVTLTKGVVILHFNITQIDFTVFDNLSDVSIRFNGITITTRLLDGLHQCNLKSPFDFINCTLENDPHNWKLLYNLRRLIRVEIREDEGTWQSLFEFVSNELIKSNSKDFRFVNDYLGIKGDKSKVNVTLIKFTIDEFNSKLQLRYTSNNKVIDLYDLKFDLDSNSKSDYDFYK